MQSPLFQRNASVPFAFPFLIFFTGLLSSLPTLAEEGFFSLSDLPQAYRPSDDRGLQRALAASFHAQIGHQGIITQCSSQFISSTGYAITALHCFEPIEEIWQGFQIVPDGLDDAKWLDVLQPVPQRTIFFRQVAGELPAVRSFATSG